MKKLMVFILAAFLAVGLIGTASAQNFARTLNTPASVFASPVTEAGVSVYVLSGGPLVAGASGVSLVAINPTSGTSVILLNGITAATAYGTPAVRSGETVFVQAVNTSAGASIYAVNGTTSTTPYYVVDIPFALSDVGDIGGGPLVALGGNSVVYTPSLTLDPSGASLYATTAPGTNVSIIALNTATGTTSFFSSGVSAIWAAPLVSGNSLYVIGDATPGVSLFAYNRTTPFATGTTPVTVLGTTNARPFATPAISGNSLFVVDATGGLTAYNKDTLAAGVNDFIQFGVDATSQVTASPVTNSNFLVVTLNTATQAGVTVFDLSRPLRGATGASWWFTWPAAGTTVIATPALSNGILYTAVNEPTGGRIDRFRLSGHSGRLITPDFSPINTDVNGATLGRFDFASPIIKNDRLIIVSNPSGAATPVLYSFDLDANGTAAWPQFKFDAERTGNNTAAAVTPAAPAGDDDSGCFISTLK